MAEDGIDKTRGSDSPYQFDPGASFFANDGTPSEDRGVDGEIHVIDPTEAFGGFGTAAPNSGGNAVSPGSPGNPVAGTAQAGERTKRKYTRRGAGTQVPGHLGGFEDAISAIHLAVAGIAKCPELELDEDEAKKVTLALDRLAGHYNVQPSETAKIWMQFAGAMAHVYGPRAIAIKKRMEQKGRPSVVTPIRGPFGP
jgi:hypothetical protein